MREGSGFAGATVDIVGELDGELREFAAEGFVRAVELAELVLDPSKAVFQQGFIFCELLGVLLGPPRSELILVLNSSTRGQLLLGLLRGVEHGLFVEFDLANPAADRRSADSVDRVECTLVVGEPAAVDSLFELGGAVVDEGSPGGLWSSTAVKCAFAGAKRDFAGFRSVAMIAAKRARTAWPSVLNGSVLSELTTGASTGTLYSFSNFTWYQTLSGESVSLAS